MTPEDNLYINKFMSLLTEMREKVFNLEDHILSVEKQLSDFMDKCNYEPEKDDQWTESRLKYLEMREKQFRKILDIKEMKDVV